MPGPALAPLKRNQVLLKELSELLFALIHSAYCT
jgi:hypothetical protein